MPIFQKDCEYTLEQIKHEFDARGGNQNPVVVKHAGEVLYIKFQAARNQHWEDRSELWIDDGVERVPDAEQWVDSQQAVPVFCGNGRGTWKYLGKAKAEILHRGHAAKRYTKSDSVELVLHMKFQLAVAA